MEFLSIEFRLHAVQRMFERGITVVNVKEVIKTGKIIESYPNDKPFQSYLLLGFINQNPLHVVIATDPDTKKTIVITVYTPDPKLWEKGFKRRK